MKLTRRLKFMLLLVLFVMVPSYWITIVVNFGKLDVPPEEKIYRLTALTTIPLANTRHIVTAMNRPTQPSHNAPPSLLYHLMYQESHETIKSRLKPAFSVSKQRSGVTMVFGVPTVYREKHSYLLETLSQLIAGIQANELNDTLIIVFIAELHNMSYVEKIARSITDRFPSQIESGLIDIISPRAAFYPDMNKLRLTLGDPLERVKWRAKQTLDFSFLMLYAQSRGKYYTQMEDDVIAKPLYLSLMKKFIEKQTNDSWFTLHFSVLGFIGKLFRTSDLPVLAEYFIMFHNDQPVDWLLDHFLRTKVCNQGKKPQECPKAIAAICKKHSPSLFQHVGLHSSLKGKEQKLKDKLFGKDKKPQADNVNLHANPKADVSTTIATYRKNSIDQVYKGEGIFWGIDPELHDTIDIKFSTPLKIKKYQFQSGNTAHPGDIFKNTSIEVLPQSHINDRGVIIETGVGYGMYKDAGDGYLIINHFNPQGVCIGSVDAKLGDISAMRLRVLQKSNSWIILSEVFIEPAR